MFGSRFGPANLCQRPIPDLAVNDSGAPSRTRHGGGLALGAMAIGLALAARRRRSA